MRNPSRRNQQVRDGTRDIETTLGLNSIEAIRVSLDMRASMDDDASDLQKWYEEELREVYAAYERE